LKDRERLVLEARELERAETENRLKLEDRNQKLQEKKLFHKTKLLMKQTNDVKVVRASEF
jgi:hypothetical protein